MAFQRATRRKVHLKLAITGQTGGGKTFSALRLAFGLGGKVAVLDTENGSAELYAHLGEYDVQVISAPFTVQKYQEAIREAAAAGYQVLVIDSLTHAWAGEGGLLAQKEALDARGGNSYTNWATITRQHEAFKAAILQAPIHIIATMRSKMDYVVEQDGKGKSAPRKVGLAPVQRDGIEYEFTTVFDVTQDHTAIASKDRTGLFNGLNAILTEEHGRLLTEWLASGAEPAPAPTTAPESRGDARASAAVTRAERPLPKPANSQDATEEALVALKAECKRLHIALTGTDDQESRSADYRTRLGVQPETLLSPTQWQKLRDLLRDEPRPVDAPDDPFADNDAGSIPAPADPSRFAR